MDVIFKSIPFGVVTDSTVKVIDNKNYITACTLHNDFPNIAEYKSDDLSNYINLTYGASFSKYGSWIDEKQFVFSGSQNRVVAKKQDNGISVTIYGCGLSGSGGWGCLLPLKTTTIFFAVGYKVDNEKGLISVTRFGIFAQIEDGYQWFEAPLVCGKYIFPDIEVYKPKDDEEKEEDPIPTDPTTGFQLCSGFSGYAQRNENGFTSYDKTSKIIVKFYSQLPIQSSTYVYGYRNTYRFYYPLISSWNTPNDVIGTETSVFRAYDGGSGYGIELNTKDRLRDIVNSKSNFKFGSSLCWKNSSGKFYNNLDYSKENEIPENTWIDVSSAGIKIKRSYNHFTIKTKDGTEHDTPYWYVLFGTDSWYYSINPDNYYKDFWLGRNLNNKICLFGLKMSSITINEDPYTSVYTRDPNVAGRVDIGLCGAVVCLYEFPDIVSQDFDDDIPEPDVQPDDSGNTNEDVKPSKTGESGAKDGGTAPQIKGDVEGGSRHGTAHKDSNGNWVEGPDSNGNYTTGTWITTINNEGDVVTTFIPDSSNNNGTGDRGSDGNNTDTNRRNNPTPTPPDKGPSGGNSDPSKIGSVTGSDGVFTVFTPTTGQLNSVLRQLNSASFLNISKQFFTTNPMDAIYSLHMLPVYTPQNENNLRIPTVGTYKFPPCSWSNTSYIRLDLGSAEIKEFHCNYLDYSDTTLEIFLPFIGYKKLDVNKYMGCTMKLTLDYSLLTGDFVYTISSDKFGLSNQFEGNFLMRIPLSRTDYTGTIKSVVNGLSSIISGGVVGGVAGGIYGGVSSGVSGVGSGGVVGGVVETSGTISGGASVFSYRIPHLRVNTPNIKDTNGGSKLLGRTLNKLVTIGKLTGYAKFSEVELSGLNAIEEEKDMISNLCKGGILI